MKRKDPAPNAPFAQLPDFQKLRKKSDPAPPSFSDLWFEAAQAVRKLIDTFPDEYWERATKATNVPILIPRRREKTNALLKILQQKGVIITGSGKIRKTIKEEGEEDHVVFNQEADSAFSKANELRRELFMMEARGDKLGPELTEIAHLPPFRTKSASQWMPRLMEAFLAIHKGEPEKSRKLKKIVEGRVDRSKISPTSKDYRNEIKKDFRKAVKRLAKERTLLLGN